MYFFRFKTSKQAWQPPKTFLLKTKLYSYAGCRLLTRKCHRTFFLAFFARLAARLLDMQPSTCDLQPSTCDPPPLTCDPPPLTCDPQPLTCNPRPSTSYPRPSTITQTLRSEVWRNIFSSFFMVFAEFFLYNITIIY